MIGGYHTPYIPQVIFYFEIIFLIDNFYCIEEITGFLIDPRGIKFSRLFPVLEDNTLYKMIPQELLKGICISGNSSIRDSF
jgi:hypothetical protein